MYYLLGDFLELIAIYWEPPYVMLGYTAGRVPLCNDGAFLD